MPERRLPKEPVISVIDDDQFVRDFLKRLMKSLGYTVAAYPSAGDFLKSSQLEETSCLIWFCRCPRNGRWRIIRARPRPPSPGRSSWPPLGGWSED